MNLKKYFIYLENINQIKIYLTESDKIVWSLEKGEYPRWNLLYRTNLNKTKNIKEIQINYELYNKILKINPVLLYYINSDLSYIKLFEKWDILNDLSEFLI